MRTATTALAALSQFADSRVSGDNRAIASAKNNHRDGKALANRQLTGIFAIPDAHAEADKTYGDDGVPNAGINRVNKCGYSAYYISVPAGGVDMVPYEVRPGDTVYSPYTVGTGVSEKYADQEFELLTPDIPVVQLEYKLGGDDSPDTIFYDLSFIDCGSDSISATGPCPFTEGGYHISFDKSNLLRMPSNCPDIYCPHKDDPNQHCRSAYYQPDDVETFVCVDTADFWNSVNMTLTFCPDDEMLAEFGAESDSDDGDEGDVPSPVKHQKHKHQGGA